MPIEVICLEDAAFYALIDRVLARVKEKQDNSSVKWLSGAETMKVLRITSKTTLQKLRDEGKIRFSLRSGFGARLFKQTLKRRVLIIINMKQELDEELDVDQQFLKGFKDGYLVKKYDPEIAAKITAYPERIRFEIVENSIVSLICRIGLYLQ